MSSGWPSGQRMVISSSTSVSISPVSATGLIIAKATKNMNAKPTSALNSRSVKTSNSPVPISSNIVVLFGAWACPRGGRRAAVQGGGQQHLRDPHQALQDAVGLGIEDVELHPQQQPAGEPGDGGEQRDGHAAGHLLQGV